MRVISSEYKKGGDIMSRKEKMLVKDAMRIVRKWRNKLGLNDFEFMITIQPLGNGNLMEIENDFVYKRAIIKLDTRWLDTRIIGNQTFERDLIHELLHTRIGVIRRMAEIMLTNDKKLTMERQEVLLILEERTVEVLARTIYKMEVNKR